MIIRNRNKNSVIHTYVCGTQRGVRNIDFITMPKKINIFIMVFGKKSVSRLYSKFSGSKYTYKICIEAR